MSCEIHDDTWHCFLQEGEIVHIKKEEWKSGEMEPVEIEFPKPDDPIQNLFKDSFLLEEKVVDFRPWEGAKLKRFTEDDAANISKEQFKEASDAFKPGFNPFGKIWDILNGEG